MEKKQINKKQINMPLIAQYIRVYLANQRKGTASTKTRAQVSGGGRKPWRQKGTGRARHGSIRSPIWVGGGVAHGPKPKDWNLNMPSKMKMGALKESLLLKENEKAVKRLDSLTIEKVSSKRISEILKEEKVQFPVLLVLKNFKDAKEKSIYLSSRNLSGVTLLQSDKINAYEVMRARNIVFINGAYDELKEKRLGSK